MTGDQVRDTGFLRPHGNLARGYDVAEVDELLRLIAAELDAGRQVGPMIEKATFRDRRGTEAYDAAVVDWFLEMLRCREDQSELARMTDPWRDLPVANYFTRRGPAWLNGPRCSEHAGRTGLRTGNTSPGSARTRVATSASSPARSCGGS